MCLVHRLTLAVGLAVLLFACGAGSSDSQDAGATPQSSAETTAVQTAAKDAIVAVHSGLKPGKNQTSYGAVFRNTSSKDAHDVIVNGSFVNRAGTILDGVGPIIPVIPAGATYYWGAEWPVKGGVPAKMEITFEPSEFSGKSAKLPKVSGVKLGSDAFHRFVSGRVTNTVGFTLSSIAPVQAVFFNRAGKVIGGASGLLPADLPPGRTARFEVSVYAKFAPKEIASVKVTVDAQPKP